MPVPPKAKQGEWEEGGKKGLKSTIGKFWGRDPCCVVHFRPLNADA